MSVLNYTDMNWDIAAVSAGAESECNTNQIHAKPHHTQRTILRVCKFNNNHIYAVFKSLWFVLQSTA